MNGESHSNVSVGGMSQSDAARILEHLAMGNFTHVGTVGAGDPCSVLEDPDVIRALFLGVRALQSREKEWGPSQVEPKSTDKTERKPWTTDEEQDMLKAYLEGRDVAEIARAGRRAKSVVILKLVQLVGVERIDRATASESPSENESPTGSELPAKSRSGQSWSADEDAKLRRDYLGGAGVARLAKSHGRSAHAVRCRLVQLGIAGKD